jgi:hypothetical protein
MKKMSKKLIESIAFGRRPAQKQSAVELGHGSVWFVVARLSARSADVSADGRTRDESRYYEPWKERFPTQATLANISS